MPDTSIEHSPERLYEDNELQTAWEFVEYTGVSIFLTGKAGTGKTTFLKTVCQRSAKTIAVVAPTGVAAINAGGVTIHSFFQLPLSPFVPGAEVKDKFNFSKDKLRIIRALDLLIIDEISMVRSDLLDAIDHTLRKYRRDQRPFGGVQLLMIGDLQQLAPVTTPADELLLRNYYETSYFFGSHALSRIQYVTIRLTTVFRQQNARFVELLNHVRDNRLTINDQAMLNSRLFPQFRPPTESDFIRLTTHNVSADSYNDSELNRIATPAFSYTARVSGTFPEYSYPTSSRMVLKTGAQVMFIKNDTVAHRYYNGRIGHVVYADPSCVKVLCPGDTEPITVEPQVWENAKFTINEQTNQVETQVQGTFTQLPLRLAWAITIHKSQGLTFDHVIIDAGDSFAPGQVYVALSRCKTLEGIVLATPIQPQSMLGDPAVAVFISSQDEEAAKSCSMLPSIKQEYFRYLLAELFTFRDIIVIQETLQRHLSQVYRLRFPEAIASHQMLRDSLKERVTEIADKWIALIRMLPYEQLASSEMAVRIGNSAVYFRNQFNELFGDLLQRTRSVQSDNKKANNRVKELVDDLFHALDARLRLLDDIACNGFSIERYLNAKKIAWIEATKGGKTATKKTRAVRKESQRKERPEKTYAISLRLFRQGMTREEVARERGLTVSTITGHLARYVASGELTLEEILTPVTFNSIVSVLDRLGCDAGYQVLSVALPDVDFRDVRLVAESMKGKGR